MLLLKRNSKSLARREIYSFFFLQIFVQMCQALSYNLFVTITSEGFCCGQNTQIILITAIIIVVVNNRKFGPHLSVLQGGGSLMICALYGQTDGKHWWAIRTQQPIISATVYTLVMPTTWPPWRRLISHSLFASLLPNMPFTFSFSIVSVSSIGCFFFSNVSLSLPSLLQRKNYI